MERVDSVIEVYISHVEPSVREKLQELYTLIRQEAPLATEKISYDMPTFHLKENLIHFAASKHHIGLYPTPSAVEAFKDELGPYKWSKGTIQLPLDKPLPVDLIRRIVRFRVKEVTGTV